jgi:putative transposase
MNKINCSLTSKDNSRQENFWKWIDQKVQQLVACLAEKVLLLQLQAHIQAGWNQRTTDRRGYRNGYYKRNLLTPHGPLSIRVPRTRKGPLDNSLVFDKYARRIADVQRVLRHAYLLGVSTRGLAKLSEQIFGGSLSHQSISQMMRWLDTQLLQWRLQPIMPVYTVVYIDGMHVDMIGSDRVVMLVSGQRQGGDTDVLGFCVSKGENCENLLSDLRQRGLDNVQLFVSDDSRPIRSALEQQYPLSSWQSCVFHRLSRLRTTIGPTPYRDSMVQQAACIFRCQSFEAALDIAAQWRLNWQSIDPWAADKFLHGLRDSLRFYQLPKKWWKRVRTNNPMERLIRTLRQRLRPMGCFHDEFAIERAVFGQLLRWNKIQLTHNT